MIPAFATSWAEFEARVLPALAEDLSPPTLGTSQMSFYFGAPAMLGIVQAVVEGARNAGSVEVALDGLRDGVEALIEASGERVN